MKRTIILFLIMIGLAGVVYSQSPSNIGTESILNRIFDSTNNALQVTLSGDLEMGTNSIDGDSSAGLVFDPDNDNTNEITMEADGDLLLDVGELILENDERLTNSTNGRFCVEGVGQTNNEDRCLDLETVANRAQISSTTGVTTTVLEGDFVLIQEGDTRTISISDTDPRLRVYSADSGNSSDFIEIYHNQSLGIIESGDDISFVVPGNDLFFGIDSGADSVRFNMNEGTAELAWGLADNVGNQIVFTNFSNSFQDHDHDTTTNPTVFINSDLSPDVSDNQWGSLYHDQENFIIETGVNVGTGSGATTDNNAIQFLSRGLLVFEIALSQDSVVNRDLVVTGGVSTQGSFAADPCTAAREGAIFYNSTANEICFCDGTNDLRIKDATTACF